jgi:methionine-rich copper-binding protein CopC
VNTLAFKEIEMKQHIGQQLVSRRRLWAVVAAVAMIAIGTAAARRDASAETRVDARFHIHLVRSEPMANETLSVVPKTINLWFSEPPELAVTGVKLAAADSAAVAVGGARVGDERPHGNPSVSATIEKTLKPGTYAVSWRTTAKDGHPAKGTFAFVVKAGARETQ